MPECPNCGADVHEGGAYCSECGQQMAGATGDVAPPPPPPPPPGGQAPHSAATPPAPGATPAGAPQQPAYTSPAAAARAQGAPKSRAGLVVLIVAALVLLLLCCCIGAVGYVAYTDSEEPVAEPVEPAEEPADEPTEETDATPAETPYVTLTWAEDADLDLEIWNETGESQLSAAWDQGDEVTSAGTEEFVFEDFAPVGDFSDGRFSTGTYSVAVFMNDAKGTTEDVEFTVVAYDGLGGQREFRSFVSAAEPDNFWEGFQIDAETGEILEVYDVHSGDQLFETE